MKSAAEYIAEAKAKLGDARMSDEKMGEHLGLSQSFINRAKHGNMADTLAVKVAKILGEEPGLLLWVARTEREKDEEMRAHLQRWGNLVGKAMARALALLALALGLLIEPPHAEAALAGGDGGIRTLDAGFARILP